MKNLIFLIFGFCLILGCTEEKIQSGDQLIIDQQQFLSTETVDFTIDTLFLAADNLHIKVAYGGCRTANARLISEDFFRESFPVQLGLKIELTDTGFCEMLVHHELIFNLSPLRQRYFEQYLQKKGTILLDLENWPELIVYQF